MIFFILKSKHFTMIKVSIQEKDTMILNLDVPHREQNP